jgi:pentatricopeptide repeat protein
VRRAAEATAEMRVVDSLNPWGVWNAGMLGLFLMFDGRLDEALVEARHAIRQFPHLDTANLRHSVVASANNIHDEAIASARRAAEQSPDLPLMQSGLASALARGGRREEAFAVLRRMEESTLPLPGALLASAWLALGARERAIEMLRLARRVQSPYLQYAFVDPRLQELRSDPDFQCLKHTG